MSALRGVVAGTLGLAFLEAVISSQQASNNVGGAFTTLATGLSYLTDVNLPLIPDLRDPHRPRPSGPSGSTQGPQPSTTPSGPLPASYQRPGAAVAAPINA